MPPALSSDEVSRIAKLSRLALSGEELQLFSRQLAGILGYVEQLQALDTTGVPPTSHPLALSSPLREDERRPSLPPADALRAAPEPDGAGGFFKVPRVIGG
jgi:aspartyl-tRNA(Asn)/glutamyl-tRNA(Gln) amidotransferase subunit C